MNGKREASCTYLINIRTGHLESFLVNDNEDSAVQNWMKKDIPNLSLWILSYHLINKTKYAMDPRIYFLMKTNK